RERQRQDPPCGSTDWCPENLSAPGRIRPGRPQKHLGERLRGLPSSASDLAQTQSRRHGLRTGRRPGPKAQNQTWKIKNPAARAGHLRRSAQSRRGKAQPDVTVFPMISHFRITFSHFFPLCTRFFPRFPSFSHFFPLRTVISRYRTCALLQCDPCPTKPTPRRQGNPPYRCAPIPEIPRQVVALTRCA